MKKLEYSLLLILFLTTLIGCEEHQRASVIIHAPLEEVWKYTGDSTKAQDWSVFFSHITPQPGLPDGQVGALRTCYRWPDESGIKWDERLEASVPMKFRKIRTFNIQNSPIPFMERFEFDVYHYLNKIDDRTTELVFASRLAQHHITPKTAWMNWVAGRKAAEIIQKNVENIKHLIENGGVYNQNVVHKLHPFMNSKDPHFDRND
jgi:hypothetical protein